MIITNNKNKNKQTHINDETETQIHFSSTVSPDFILRVFHLIFFPSIRSQSLPYNWRSSFARLYLYSLSVSISHFSTPSSFILFGTTVLLTIFVYIFIRLINFVSHLTLSIFLSRKIFSSPSRAYFSDSLSSSLRLPSTRGKLFLSR